MQPSDVQTFVDGSVVGFKPLTETAQTWIAEHVQSEPWQWMGNTLWVDRRYARDLMFGMMEAGLEVS